jgi:hypothetical protein
MKILMNNNFAQSIFLTCALILTHTMHASNPLGMFVPYDINIRLKKPATGNFQCNILGEKSYNVQGYATNDCGYNILGFSPTNKEDETFLVNVLQIYEPIQNVVSMYQGFDNAGSIVQTLHTPFTQLLESIAGGPGGGVSNLQNGIYSPSATMSCGQIALGATYGLGQGFYISAFIPYCFARLSDIEWKYAGSSVLFANAQIQQQLINNFTQDSLTYFNLNVGNWRQQGFGDVTFIAEWQRDFMQRRPVLNNVQVNARMGISIPTGVKANESVIMPVSFGADGAISVPFGAGLGFSLGRIAECGFSGQFWCYLSNQKARRVKSFPTQTSLLFPIITQTYKEFSVLQNFNLYLQFYTLNKRLSAKGLYQHWRKQKDTIFALDNSLDFAVINSALSLEECTRHQFSIFGIYSPLKGDFSRIIPQLEIFWKGSFGGTRAATASTYGAQFALIF